MPALCLVRTDHVNMKKDSLFQLGCGCCKHKSDHFPSFNDKMAIYSMYMMHQFADHKVKKSRKISLLLVYGRICSSFLSSPPSILSSPSMAYVLFIQHWVPNKCWRCNTACGLTKMLCDVGMEAGFPYDTVWSSCSLSLSSFLDWASTALQCWLFRLRL